MARIAPGKHDEVAAAAWDARAAQWERDHPGDPHQLRWAEINDRARNLYAQRFLARVRRIDKGDEAGLKPDLVAHVKRAIDDHVRARRR